MTLQFTIVNINRKRERCNIKLFDEYENYTLKPQKVEKDMNISKDFNLLEWLSNWWEIPDKFNRINISS